MQWNDGILSYDNKRARLEKINTLKKKTNEFQLSTFSTYSAPWAQQQKQTQRINSTSTIPI